MTDTAAFLYERFVARDPAYDGRMIVGVLTTGIYCRFSCTARKPHFHNVRFYEDIPSARADGLRPCRRCHPDLASPDTEAALIDGIAERLPARLPDVQDVRALAALAGVGSSTLTRLFRRRLGLTPAAFLARARVDAAARRLTETEQPVLDIAFGVGFASASAFHARFRALTGLTPASYRTISRAQP
jgi:AraC family transcriptional regulator of adaptative response / DNA-3-methyladenine glycosylase II